MSALAMNNIEIVPPFCEDVGSDIDSSDSSYIEEASSVVGSEVDTNVSLSCDGDNETDQDEAEERPAPVAILSIPQNAFPENVVTEEEFFDFLQTHHSERLEKCFSKKCTAEESVEKCRGVSKNHGIKERRFIQPLSDIMKMDSMKKKVDVFKTLGVQLACDAIRAALEKNNIHESEVTEIIFISQYQWTFPSLVAYIMKEFNFDSTTQHQSLASHGCSGGATLIRNVVNACQHPRNACTHSFTSKRKNAASKKGRDGAVVLGVALEMSSLAFNTTKADPAWLINTTLFGDAASAVIGFSSNHPKAPGNRKNVAGQGIAIQTTQMETCHELTEIGGFEYPDHLGYHFSQQAKLVEACMENCPAFISQLTENGLNLQPAECDYSIIHPGGKRIFEAIHQELKLEKRQLDLQLASFETIGNCASCSVLDLLEIASRTAKDGDSVFCCAFGPGFLLEGSSGHFIGGQQDTTC